MSDEGGWYPDPEGEPGRERWWDGTRWTERTRSPSDELAGFGERARPRTHRRPPPVALFVTAGVALLVLVGILVATRGGPDGNPTADPTGIGITADPTEGPNTGRPSTAPVFCPTGVPTVSPPTATATPPPSRASRVSDPQAGISYAGQSEPWQTWSQVWITDGLNARFATGYFLVTQTGTPGGDYYATVLSGTVATRVADAPSQETRCIAEQLAEDVRGDYYPEPNKRQDLDSRAITVAGRPGYLIRYHLTFDVTGYAAKGEQVGVLVLNVGRPELAVLYISVPDTVHGFDYVFDQVFASVRAT